MDRPLLNSSQKIYVFPLKKIFPVNLRRSLSLGYLEKMYSKDEILEMYLNITYLGEGNYGIQAASQYYYHIDAINLNKQQSDILVKTLKEPSVYNPSKVN